MHEVGDGCAKFQLEDGALNASSPRMNQKTPFARCCRGLLLLGWSLTALSCSSSKPVAENPLSSRRIWENLNDLGYLKVATGLVEVYEVP